MKKKLPAERRIIMMTIMFLFFLFALGALSTCRNIACGAQGEYTLRSAFSALLAFFCACLLLISSMLT